VENQELLDEMNTRTPGFIKMLGGKIIAVDPLHATCTMEFNVSTDFCHSTDVVQGGFITTMLDAAMTHAAFGIDRDIANVSSLEIKTSYLEPTLAGRLHAVGKVIRRGHKIAFFQGELFDENGVLTATTSSVGKLSRK
jgi:uncharacterized protein (TIGR00369 family)